MKRNTMKKLLCILATALLLSLLCSAAFASALVDWITPPNWVNAKADGNVVTLMWPSKYPNNYKIYERINGLWIPLYYVTDSGEYYTSASFTADEGYHTYGVSCIWKSSTGDYYESSNVRTQSITVEKPVYSPGWQQINGKWYYCNKNGEIVVGWVHDGGWYFMKADGSMTTGWANVAGSWYYFGSDGAMRTGWTKVGNTWYFFKPSGEMLTGWYKSGGTWYYFKSSGAMATGWVSVGSSWYWFDQNGAMATGWKLINQKWEYFSASGAWQYTWNGK